MRFVRSSVVAVLVLVGCAKSPDSESESGTESGTESELGSGTESGSESSASGEGDSSGGSGCEPTEFSSCSLGPCGPTAASPMDFDHCGDSNLFDVDGCMRPQCETASDCAVGEVCYSTLDCFPDACVPSSWACDGTTGTSCMCGGPGDCSEPENAVRWCIPAGSVPC